MVLNEREQTGFRIEGASSIIMMNEFVITYLEEMGKLREQIRHQSGSVSRFILLFFIIITIFDPISPPNQAPGKENRNSGRKPEVK